LNSTASVTPEGLTTSIAGADGRPGNAQLFKAIFESSAAGMLVLDLDGRCVCANQAFCDLTGYTAEEVVARTVAEITHPDDVAVSLQMLRRLAAGEAKSSQLEKRYAHKSGRPVWVLLTATLIPRSGQLQPDLAVELVQDITQRRAAEAALRGSKAALRTTAENAGHLQGMQGGGPISPASSYAPVKNTIIVVALGVIGLLTITQWTAITVRKHVRIASHFLFPAALSSQRATSAFQRMYYGYSDAVVMQEKGALDDANREAAAAVSSLANAGTSMEFNSGRHQQIVSLLRRVSDLQVRSKVLYAAAADVKGIPPRQEDLADLAHENKAVQTALEALRSDLASDFRDELGLIDKLVRIQGMLETVLLVGVIIALFFSTRALIAATARRRGDEVLRQAHRDTEVLLNSVPSLLIGLDANGHIRQWNKTATLILEWEEATVPGKTLDECGVKWLTPDISARVAAHVQDSSGNDLDDVKLERNGITRLLGLNAIRLNTDGAAGILVVGADITERMTLEQQLRQAQKLEAIGQLAAGIAHEINTPIQYVGDNTRFLQESWRSFHALLAITREMQQEATPGPISPQTLQRLDALAQGADFEFLQTEIPHAIEQSLEGIQRVTKIVQAMKEFSHPGSEEKKSININQAIETTITVARNEWKYVADVETHFAPDLPLVLCHAGEFNQVILNLLINAAQAIAQAVGDGSQGKGKIVVCTARDQDWAGVSISDTGVGIPEAVGSRVFEPFFTTKPVGKGTGQGLALAHTAIVRRHGGKIWFDSEVGKGTTFYIQMPLAQSSEG
jgi:PAS domain S-box-containing protein